MAAFSWGHPGTVRPRTLVMDFLVDGNQMNGHRARRMTKQNSITKLDDEWPESIFHHVGSQSVS